MLKEAVPHGVLLLWDLALENPHTLQVYQRVPLAELIPSSRKRPEIDPSLRDLRFSYVLCQGTAVLLAVTPWDTFGSQGRRSPRLDETSIPGLLVVKDMQTVTYQDIIRSKLAEREASRPGPVWRYRPHPVPERDRERFCRKRLLEPRINPWSAAEYLPTDYGRAVGLSAGYTMDEDGTVHCFPIGSKELLASLRKPWTDQEASTDGKVPLALRLRRLDAGEPSSPGCSWVAASQLIGMTLENYMAGLPNDLETLVSGLGVERDMTYWEAAEAVYRLWDRTMAQDMLLYLCAPMEAAYRKREGKK